MASFPLGYHWTHSLRHLARLLTGRDVRVSHKVQVEHVILGSEYGKWPLLPAMTSPRSIVYSFGVGEDISFDLATIQRFRCHVYAFDPTPKAVQWMKCQNTPAEFHFYQLGIATEPGNILFYPPRSEMHASYTISQVERPKREPFRAEVADLRSIMQRLQHQQINILKMDVEGAEYAVIETLAQQPCAPEQLMVEFHHGLYGYTSKDTKTALATLTRLGYYPYYVSSTWREVGFLHKDSAIGMSLENSASSGP